MVHDLRELLRLLHARAPRASAVVLDGRTLQSSPESGGRAGYDGYKRKKGSKVHLAVDTLGYPQGTRAFRRDCAFYLGMPLKQWLFRRRIELAHMWLRYSPATEDEVATRLGDDNLRQFRGDLKRWGHFSPLELKTLQLLCPVKPDRVARLPFWFPDGEAKAAKYRQNTSDFCTLAMLAPTRSIQRALLRKYSSDQPQPACGSGETYPLINDPPAAEVPIHEGQETELENVIPWEVAEKWGAGTAPLNGNLLTFAIAA